MNNTNISFLAFEWWDNLSYSDQFERGCNSPKEVMAEYIKEHPQPISLFEQMAELTKPDNVVIVKEPELRDMAILRIARKSLMDVNFTAWHVADAAAKWQKEQSDKSIKDLHKTLLNAKENMSLHLIGRYGKDFDPQYHPSVIEIENAINKYIK